MDKPHLSATESIQNQTNQAQDTGKWQHISPIAIVYFAVGVVKQLIGNFIYLIPALAVGYKSLLEHPYIWLPGLLAAFALLMAFAYASFRVYRYRLSDSNIEIRSGIFSKKYLDLPFSRVQNVKFEQPIYYRLSGHVCMQLDTAGSAKNEAKLVAIKLDFAEQLKTEIQSQHNNAAAEELDAESAETANHTDTQGHEQVLNTRNLSDLVIHGITSNRIWIFLGGLAPFFDNIADFIGESLQGIGIDLAESFSLETHSLLEVGLYALSLTMLIMLVLVTFSIIGSIISFYGYTLSKLNDKYIRRSGLFTKHEVSMRLSRLQMVVQKQDWLDVALKRINLKFEQNSSLSKSVDPSAANSKIIVPSIKPDESFQLIKDAYPTNNLESLINQHGFTAISKRFITRNILFIWTPIWLIFIAITLANQQYAQLGISVLAFLVICALVILRWKRWGIARDQQYIYLRKGLLGVDYYCFPAFKIQQTQFLQSLLMKNKKLASVKFVLASGSVKIPFILEEMALNLVDDCLYQVESSDQSWM